jgi:hypothetical protein
VLPVPGAHRQRVVEHAATATSGRARPCMRARPDPLTADSGPPLKGHRDDLPRPTRSRRRAAAHRSAHQGTEEPSTPPSDPTTRQSGQHTPTWACPFACPAAPRCTPCGENHNPRPPTRSHANETSAPPHAARRPATHWAARDAHRNAPRARRWSGSTAWASLTRTGRCRRSGCRAAPHGHRPVHAADRDSLRMPAMPDPAVNPPCLWIEKGCRQCPLQITRPAGPRT